MSKEVPWSDKVLRNFIEKAMLNEDEIFLLTTRIKGWGIIRQATELGCSERTVGRIIKELKHKYDLVQSEFPNEFPQRNKKSATDRYLDTH